MARADLSNAEISGAKAWLWPDRGISPDQLYSTASYQRNDLREFKIRTSDLTDFSFAGQDLRAAEISGTKVRDTNFESANLAGAYFGGLWDVDTVTRLFVYSGNMAGANLKNVLFAPNSGDWVFGFFDLIQFSPETTYNQWTHFPPDFDPQQRGLTYIESATGDVDGSDGLTVTDVDYLMRRIRSGDLSDKLWSWFHEEHFMPWHFEMFDLNADQQLDINDLNTWVTELRKTWHGDANLDGEFNSSDLVAVFQAGLYEDAAHLNASWSTGDWNGDGKFDSGDLVTAFQAGGFEQGLRTDVNIVPEPSGILLIPIAMFLLMCRSHQHAG